MKTCKQRSRHGALGTLNPLKQSFSTKRLNNSTYITICVENIFFFIKLTKFSLILQGLMESEEVGETEKRPSCWMVSIVI